MTRLTIILLALCAVPAAAEPPDAAPTGGTCFLRGESRDGAYKVCIYDCLRGTAAITVRSWKLCPLTIRM